MSRVILIADADMPLGAELVRGCLERGDRVVGLSGEPAPEAPGAKVPAAGGLPAPADGGPAAAWTRLEWRRHNPVSALNGLLSALNRHDRLDEVLVINAPPAEKKALHETPLAGIEEAMDRWAKGGLFLVREVLRLFRRQEGGQLAMINYIPLESGAILSPLESAVWGSFQALSESLLASCAGEPYLLNGFESHAARPEDFARFILSSLKQKAGRSSGRWFRFQTRSGLLSGLGRGH